MFLSWMTSSNMIRIINIWRMRCIHENEILIKFIQTYWYMAWSPSALKEHITLYIQLTVQYFVYCKHKFLIAQTSQVAHEFIYAYLLLYLGNFTICYPFENILVFLEHRERTFPIKYKYYSIYLVLDTLCWCLFNF